MNENNNKNVIPPFQIITPKKTYYINEVPSKITNKCKIFESEICPYITKEEAKKKCKYYK